MVVLKTCNEVKIKIKILGSECQRRGMYAKRAKQATAKKTTLRLACAF
jgi:hypothetical protein